MAKYRIVIDTQRCKACGLCLAFCPQQCLRQADILNEIGYRPVEQHEPERCTGCGLCALMCPDICFTIFRLAETEPTGQDVTAAAPAQEGTS